MMPHWSRREFLVLCPALISAADAAGQATNSGGRVAQRSADVQQNSFLASGRHRNGYRRNKALLPTRFAKFRLESRLPH